LKKAEEVRLENGPQRIEKSLKDLGMLAKRDARILDDVSPTSCHLASLLF